VTPPPYPDWLVEIVRPGETRTDDDRLMTIALDVARASIARTGGGPFAALVVDAGGCVVGVGWNEVVPTHDPTAHAEIGAIRRATAVRGDFRLADCTMIATCAPCIMCSGAIHWAGCRRVVAGARATDAQAIGFTEGPREFDARACLEEFGVGYLADVRRDDAVALLRRYAGPVYNGRP
jgi:tRNA(Arg) A34 adenosine deaminase TadA